MSSFLSSLHGDWWLGPRSDPCPWQRAERVRFFGASDALAFVEELLRDPHGRPALRRWASRDSVASIRRTDDELAQQLARAPTQSETGSSMRRATTERSPYFAAIPRTPVSCCPRCGEPLVRTFDPYGLDGLWWRSSAEPEEPRACRHFCLLRGALDLAGEAPRGGDFEAHVGPAVPYVIPRILALPGVVAVVSRIRTADHHLAYPVAYFAERRPPPQELTAGWARTNHVYQTQLGEVRWRVPNDPWDLELRPWLERGKLRWCTSDGKTFVLGPESEAFPYLDLPGERRPQVLKGSALGFEPPPDGSILREPPDAGWPDDPSRRP